VLQGRLNTRAFTLAIAVAVGGCASVDGTERGAIREGVIEPGITAIEQAGELACGQEASMIRSALEIYEVRKGEPAPNEAALIGNGLREESELWDVRDGVLTPADPGCGEVPTEVPTQEIVTEDEPATADEIADLRDEIDSMTPAELVADATDEEIAEVGGPDCAYEVAEVGLAFARFTLDNDAEPTSLMQLVDAGYLERLVLWTLTDVALEPVPGTSCIGPFELIEQGPDGCAVDRRTLEVAIEAYTLQFGSPPDNEQQLVDAEMLRTRSESYDVVYGEIVPGDGSPCG
jgi:competence protein ComGC